MVEPQKSTAGKLQQNEKREWTLQVSFQSVDWCVMKMILENDWIFFMTVLQAVPVVQHGKRSDRIRHRGRTGILSRR